MVNESPELKEDQPSIRSTVNNLAAGAISFGSNPFASTERHRHAIAHLTRPIALMGSDEDRTNVFTASYDAGRILFKNYLRFPTDLFHKMEKLTTKLTEALKELVEGKRVKVKETLGVEAKKESLIQPLKELVASGRIKPKKPTWDMNSDEYNAYLDQIQAEYDAGKPNQARLIRQEHSYDKLV